MNIEKMVLTKSTDWTNKEPKNFDKNHYIVTINGSSIDGLFYSKTRSIRTDYLEPVDIAMLAYFNTSWLPKEWASEYEKLKPNENIGSGPLSFILPYLYDYETGMDLFDIWFDNINSIEIKYLNDNGDYINYELPKITDLYVNLDEFIAHVKSEIKRMRPTHKYEKGEEVQPWEIEEAREVLKAQGWDETELKYLKWMGNCRGFASCSVLEQKEVDYVLDKIKDIDDPKLKFAWNRMIKACRFANMASKEFCFNGPLGMCGNYIYRVDPENIPEWMEEDDLVRMPDGRIYHVHEGD